MERLIAICPRQGSFSERWIEYCAAQGIAYKLVDCLDTSVIAQLAGVDGLLWNWRHGDAEEQLAARQVLMAAERMGIEVYPDALTSWHYDDKIAQKYLLEALDAPLIPSYVFFDCATARRWVEKASFPKVFKLRCGASSSNVRLVKTRDEAARLCRTMFGKGCPGATANYFADLRRKVRQVRGWRQFLEKVKRIPASLRDLRHARQFLPMQRGYVYFQDFLPNNAFDTRVMLVGTRIFACRRMNRPGDFRASGSGDVNYDRTQIDSRCLRIASDLTRRLKAQSLAFDFLFDENHEPMISEIAYTTQAEAVYQYSGYWDEDFNWHEGHYWIQDFILQDLLARLGDEKRPVPPPEHARKQLV